MEFFFDGEKILRADKNGISILDSCNSHYLSEDEIEKISIILNKFSNLSECVIFLI